MSAAKKQPIQDDLGMNGFDNIPLSQATYEKFASHMYDLAGVNLPYSTKNHALVRNRIVKLLRVHGFDTYEQYWSFLKAGNEKTKNEFISALTTNMTSFYRESSHFDFLKEILPPMLQKHGSLRIWCAAASTGQEPYTIAMTVNEALTEEVAPRVKILATDIDLQVLKKAANGVYEERACQGLDEQKERKYFQRVTKDGDIHLRAKDNIHQLLHFAPFNLMNPTFDFKNQFHVIFCRNVLIYFDEPTTKKVIENLVKCLAPGGYLILGHSESGNIKNDHLKPMSRAIYLKI